ncbi:hypothetical protein PPL_07014 [Heterostelium album PN500]|uniref:IPT/TIG domain-containing protein n=1 Tax=Heterostelium pallidum (strain ATCC 26659 / Pp 5 / PN500) TaxID=670386 RepID=D3BE61_HETP5|nr:hypothetical protein PPL_07014 [Heterostelium album PN500]EFA80192.1 hypothetical protein PPL_07014 [Heterostelium album PN500]|eukprot:XP_020432312.1 hypothetical protein PPL_07014 [Heterostelium album PN500]
MVLKLLNILIIYVIGSFLSTNQVVDSQVITFISPLVGYKFTTPKFTIRGTDFAFNPVLSIANVIQPLKIFNVIPNDISTFIWDITNPNRLDKNFISVTYGSKVIFPILPFEDAFYLFAFPTINSFTPEFYYPRGLDNQVELTINGEYLKLSPNDPHPTVFFRNTLEDAQLTVISSTPNQVKCTIPRYPNDVEVDFSIVVIPPGLANGALAPRLFYYVLPLQKSVEPSRGTTNFQQITITGKFFIENPQSYVITVDGTECKISKRSPTKTICDFFYLKYVPPGTSVSLPINSIIDGQTVHGLVNYMIYGNFLGQASSVMIGPVICDIQSVDNDRIECVCNSKGNYVGEKYVLVIMPSSSIFAKDNFVFYQRPSITKISPTHIYDSGVWDINVFTERFTKDNYVVVDDEPVDVITVSETVYKVNVDQSIFKMPVGDNYRVTINSHSDDTIISDPMILSVVESRATIIPYGSYIFSETPVEVEFLNLPIVISSTVAITATINDQQINGIEIVNPTKISFTIPPSTWQNKNVDISINFPYNKYSFLFDFTYVEPTFTDFIKPELTLWQGGGYFEFHGQFLSLISSIKLGDVYIDRSICTDFTDTLIKCLIPANTPALYNLVLYVKDNFNIVHSYENPQWFIEYQGPSIESISPQRGSKRIPNTLFIYGINFNNDPNLVQVTVGNVQCKEIKIMTPGELIACEIPPMATVGYLDVIVTVDGIASDRPAMKFFDGIDLWMVIADTFKKRMFVQMYSSKDNSDQQSQVKYPMQPTQQVLNVAELELPVDLCPSLLLHSGSAPRFSYLHNEHSKLGFPFYPKYSSETDNNGDNNRHNGQGQRGGGAICFVHDTLVYQFNRMVRKYDTYNSKDLQTTADNDAVSLFYSTSVPIKVTRENQHPTLNFEIKDFIGNEHFSKYPPQYIKIKPDTLNSGFDITINIQALRTSRNFVAPQGENPVVYVGGDVPGSDQMDISNYYANDIFSLHYIAYDSAVGSICDNRELLFRCTRELARVSHIETTDKPLPDYPPNGAVVNARALKYNLEAGVRNFAFPKNGDFSVMELTSQFQRNSLNTQQLFNYIIDKNLQQSGYFSPEPSWIFRQNSDLCSEEIAYLMTLQYLYSKSPNTDSLIYTVGEDVPNWANGILYQDNDPIIYDCFSIVTGFKNIEKYPDVGNMDNPSDSLLFMRSASAAWSWMNPKYQDGSNAARTKDDTIPVEVLEDLMIRVLQNTQGTIRSLSNFFDFIGDKYKSVLNFKTILERNNIIAVSTEQRLIVNILQIKLPSSFLKSQTFTSTVNDSSTIKSPLLIDELSTKSGIQQLISTQLINESDVYSLNIFQTEKLEIALDKWISIKGQSQAIQTLIWNPVTQYHNQPIKFIQELNHYQIGNRIDLISQSIGTTGTKITLSSPLSIVSITFILESILMSDLGAKTKIGDLEIYYLPKPDSYQGYITDDYDGMIISTINSQLCDIQMITLSDFQSNNFDLTCSGIGPIITFVNQLTGITDGGYPITINGIRFNSSMTVSIRDNECKSTIFISSELLICIVPSGVGRNNEIQISTEQTIFNVQRTKYLFSYGTPQISNVQPETIKSYGSDFMTITGSNFGDDVMKVQVLIDDKLECLIDFLSSESIVCLTPPAIGDHRSVTVIVADQSSTINIDTLVQQSFSFSGPEIISFVPSSGDPNDKIIILGEGFRDEEDYDFLPLLYIGDNQVQIDNFTNDFIEFDLEYETSIQPLIIQSSDQSLYSQFTYYQPILTQFNNSLVNTTGGLIEIYGAGLGISFDYVEIYLNANEIECNSFNEFIECLIPPGIGSNLVLSATLSSEPIELTDNFTISYTAPKILSAETTGINTIKIYGFDFVPVELGVTFNVLDSNIQMIYSDRNETCNDFISSVLAECSFIDMPQAVQIIVGGQYSNIHTF